MDRSKTTLCIVENNGKNDSYKWIDFYMELSTKLLEFKVNRTILIQKIKRIYSDTGIKLPKLESDHIPKDIDPFTVFGLFNKGINYTKRMAIIRKIAAEFGITAAVPDAFDGIPVLNNLKATFYFFQEDRGQHDIDNLWELFEAALDYADDVSDSHRKTFISLYDRVLTQHGIRWNITMGLYWIRPYIYINLDEKNRRYMSDPDHMPLDYVLGVRELLHKVPSAEQYLAIIKLCRDVLDTGKYKYKTFPELSFHAWLASVQANQVQRTVNSSTMTVTEKNGDRSVLSDSNVHSIRYWIYAPGQGAVKWDECFEKGIMLLGWGEIGDLNAFNSKNEMKQKMKEIYGNNSSYVNSGHATWQFLHEMKTGDIVFVKKGFYGILGRGVVDSDYKYDAGRSDRFNHVRCVKWTHKGEWTIQHQTPQKTLTDITPYSDFVQQINDLFDAELLDKEEMEAASYPAYTPDDFLDEVYMERGGYNDIVDVFKNKKNIILQGAPGVGKTFVAKRLAYSIMGVKDVKRVLMVQFHQSYSYEDFIMGFRPTVSGFELREGVFYKFCKEAEKDSDNDYFFIIDEINRGNLSKIFGELFMLIENDKRGVELQLLYSNEIFAVPRNVYIIGMMNTADRSLAILDYALRRRFAFIEIKPGFETERFRAYQSGLDNAEFDHLITCVKKLNKAITDDDSLGEGFCIGHSYFCNLSQEMINDRTLSRIVEYELVPLLKEYWFDEPAKIRQWTTNLRNAIR